MTTANIHLIVLLIVFLCTFGGALAGLLIRAVLPAHHFDDESKGAVNVAAATVSVLTALVISSLITSARGAFETTTAEVEELSANLVLLDRVMAHYGPEADPARDLLRRYTILKIDLTWPKERTRKPVLDDPAALELLETLQDELRALEPKSEAQRWLQSRALQVSGDLAQTRWKLAVQNASAIPRPFLMVVVAWLDFSLRQLRALRAAQSHRDHRLAGGRALRLGRDCFDPRAGQPIRRVHHRLGRADAERSGAPA